MQPHSSSFTGNPQNNYQEYPYMQHTPQTTYYNSHYLQAYAQALPQPSQPSTSLTFNANASFLAQAHQERSHHGSTRNFSSVPSSSWYQPGNHRCTYQGCAFTGSAKSVELHMMDRHLICPPGWDKRKKKPEWDADPSLKGKPIPIQGTNVVLDSPEVLAAWIEERKRRFPTSSRVDEKKRKMEEAVARGQLDLSVAGIRTNKRRKIENQPLSELQNKKSPASKQKHSTTANLAGPTRVPDSGWGARSKVAKPQPHATTTPIIPSPSPPAEPDSDDGEPPEAVSSKIAPPIDTKPTEKAVIKDEVPAPSTRRHPKDNRFQKKPHGLQPRAQPQNPFAGRPKLLRNLLLPEIRVTVSNLSQAIRFLVDNDFLRDVELKPGQAEERNKIQVVPQHEGKAQST